MKHKRKLLAFIIITILAVFAIVLYKGRLTYTSWQITSYAVNKDSLSWAAFTWVSEDLSGKHFDRTSMFIPCRLDDIPNIVSFQFDLGADLTGVYETNYSSFYPQNPQLKDNIKKVSFSNKKYFGNINIRFGDYAATTPTSYVFAGYGELLDNMKPGDTIHIGTIAGDMFKNKVLIMDYPRQRFAIADTLPAAFSQVALTAISLDKKNRALLPLTIKGKTYKVLFDNGSSIFPLLTNANRMAEFSNSPDVDTIQISSWGVVHGVTGKWIKEPFTLGGQQFNAAMIYADHRKIKDNNEWDAIAGNALFWNNTIIIDFRNKKFGVKYK